MAARFPLDDATIPDDELLYVRIFPRPDNLQPNEDGFGLRPASGTLRRHDQPLSVDRGSLCTPQQTRNRGPSPTYHVAAFTAGIAREYGCRIVKDAEEGNPAHALVYGDHDDDSLSKSQQKQIARRATIVLMGEPGE